jgi:hypothetical protein
LKFGFGCATTPRQFTNLWSTPALQTIRNYMPNSRQQYGAISEIALRVSPRAWRHDLPFVLPSHVVHNGCRKTGSNMGTNWEIQQLKYHYSILSIPQPQVTEKNEKQNILKPESENMPIHINHLLICKRIYFEFKDLVWRVNVFGCQERFADLNHSQQAWSLFIGASSRVVSGISAIGHNIRRLELHANIFPEKKRICGLEEI